MVNGKREIDKSPFGTKQVKYRERVYEAGAPVKQKSASFALGPQASKRSGGSVFFVTEHESELAIEFGRASYL